jgi:hypothetical protein
MVYVDWGREGTAEMGEWGGRVISSLRRERCRLVV